MKNTFLKFGLILALGLTKIVFNSCDKEDDNDGVTNGGDASKIIATNVVNSSSKIIAVTAFAHWVSLENYHGFDAIAQAPYQNNGFTLELPTILGDKYLETIDADDFEGISVSDRNFKSGSVDKLMGRNEDNDGIGYFYLEEENENSTHIIFWLYVDRDVTIKGEYNEINEEFDEEYTEQYALTLKKGWNIIYESEREIYKNGKDVWLYTMSSKKPSGVNYTWNFDDANYAYSSESIALKSAKYSKSFSSKLKGNRRNSKKLSSIE